MQGEPRIKGLAFRSSLAALETIRDEQVVDRTLSRLSDDVERPIRLGEVVPNGWYPVAWYAALLESVSKEPGGEELLLQVGRQSAEHDFTRIHRVLLRLLSPTTIMKVVGRVYRRYFTHGSIEVVAADRGYLRVRWVDCAGFNRPMWLDAYGAAETILELADTSELDMHLLAGGRDGDRTMEVEARFS